ncbi:renalase-like [Mercenaria mercenaria]|uniref:renalase-like n=1 Tax=Mercenaria mercenaria TaxID=6596 RepID=UPI00234ED49D|nr:renalase-like [Mercenaria mercenaria]
MLSGSSVAVIGGGISGLVCANRLSQLGINNTTVFDTGKHAPGGRCSSRQVIIDGRAHVFDHSAQYFTVTDSRFAKIVSYLHRKGAVKIWNGKLGHLKSGKFSVDKNITQAFIGVNGMQDIPKCLAETLNLKNSTWAGNVSWEAASKKWRVDRHGYFDYLVIAHNGKCADKLMSSAGAPQVHRLTQVRFCHQPDLKDKRMQLCSLWALLVSFPTPLKLPFEGVHVEDTDISWMANNTAKLRDPSRQQTTSNECWTVFSTRQFGSRNKCPQENIPPKVEKEVTDRLLQAMKRVTGLAQLPVPNYTRVQLWGAAVPMNILKTGDECVFDGQHNVGICGDWLTSPCIQGAVVSGLALAERINKHYTGADTSSTVLVPDFVAADGGIIGAFPTDANMVFKPSK